MTISTLRHLLVVTGLMMLLCSCQNENFRSSAFAAELDELPKIVVNSYGIELIKLSGGQFKLGTSSGLERTNKERTVNVNPFYMSQSEVTQGVFLQYLNDVGKIKDAAVLSKQLDPGEYYIREGIVSAYSSMGHLSYDNCLQFCKWLSKKEGVTYRLPFEREWEFACRAGSDTRFWWGNQAKDNLYMSRDMPPSAPYHFANPSGVYPKNPFGFYNFYSGVAEWCTNERGRNAVLRGGDRYWPGQFVNSFSRFNDLKSGGIRLVISLDKRFKQPDIWSKPVLTPPLPKTMRYESKIEKEIIPLSDAVDLHLIKLKPGVAILGTPVDNPYRAFWEYPNGFWGLGVDVVKDLTLVIPIDESLYVGQYEITEEQWNVVVNKMKGESMVVGYTHGWIPYYAPHNLTPVMVTGEKVPVRNLSFDNGAVFCQLLTKHERQAGRLSVDEEYRLPKEWEWEYAARASSETIFHFGNNEAYLPHFAWYNGVVEDAVTVGQKLPNQWGFYDMYGNVEEMCSNNVGSLFRNADYRIRARSPDYGRKCVRGGSWNKGFIACRSGSRIGYRMEQSIPWLGLRVVRASVGLK